MLKTTFQNLLKGTNTVSNANNRLEKENTDPRTLLTNINNRNQFLGNKILHLKSEPLMLEKIQSLRIKKTTSSKWLDDFILHTYFDSISRSIKDYFDVLIIEFTTVQFAANHLLNRSCELQIAATYYNNKDL